LFAPLRFAAKDNELERKYKAMFTTAVPSTTSKIDALGSFVTQLWDRHFIDPGLGSKVDIQAAHARRAGLQASLPTKCLIAVLLLIGAASSASAQYLPYKGCSSLRERGYYGTPTGGGPQYDYGGGDQYGYGPGYSYARQAAPCNSRETSRVGAQRGLIAHEK
jgi:hypothetical protein